MPETGLLRVIDFGDASPLRSQTSWHAIASGVSAGAPPTLSFVRPSGGYVGIGYHRDLDEVDEKYCRRNALPIHRRMVGGGPVYLDAGQLFFQICLPARAVAPSRLTALRDLLAPAVSAFRSVGVDAELDRNSEICLGDRKICGHGAGQIEDAVVVCGNLIERFDHERASRVLRLPDEEMRADVEQLMRRYIAPTPTDAEAFKQALIAAYAAAFRADTVDGRLSDLELAELDRLDDLFERPEWLTGQQRRTPAAARQVKIKSEVWIFSSSTGSMRVRATMVDDVVVSATLRSARLPAVRLQALERALPGVDLHDVAGLLSRIGGAGSRTLAAAFARADGRTL